MAKNWVIGISSVTLAIATSVQPGAAIPGQTIEAAIAWIRAHPTLKPGPGERLLVRKFDTPAKRFTFQALPLPVGRLAPGTSTGVIRSEEILLVDLVNGVSRDRLSESLRIIYGANIYHDYTRASTVQTFPNGELREGDFFAYQIELFPSRPDFAEAGRITVFLRADLNKRQTEIKETLEEL
jgi:hypothetical protein